MPAGDRIVAVLIVDDEELIADTLSLILNQNGFDARAVYSGETGMVLARHFRPDVLISDIRMTGMSGIELALQVEKELPDCRIILYSGQSASADQLQRTDGHLFELLSKPVQPEVFLNRLAS
jgi:DNA-binding NtrC family response regulator